MLERGTISEVDMHWLVGWLEGEGSFGVRRYGWSSRNATGTSIQPVITLGCIDRDVIERAYRILGIDTSIMTRIRRHNKPFHYCYVTGHHAIFWMEKLYPHLGKRRQEAINSVFSQKPHFGSPHKKLNWAKVDKLRTLHSTGLYTHNKLADMFGVSRSLVTRIVNNQSWVRHTIPDLAQ